VLCFAVLCFAVLCFAFLIHLHAHFLFVEAFFFVKEAFHTPNYSTARLSHQ